MSAPAAQAPSAVPSAPNWRRLARLHLPKARLGPGSGPWLSISECLPQVVHFHPTEQAANRSVEWLDSTGCGGDGCRPAGPSGLAAHWTMPLADD